MSEAVLMKLIDQAPPILTGLGVLLGVLLSWRNGRKSDAIKTQNDDLKTQGDDIHALVNSNLDRVKKQLALALSRIDDLERAIDHLTSDAAPVVSVIAKGP